MDDKQLWYKSRGVYGSLISLLTAVASGSHYYFSPEEQKMIFDLVVTFGGSIGGVLSLIGRMFAKKLF